MIAHSAAVLAMLALAGCTSTPVAEPTPPPTTAPASPTPVPTATTAPPTATRPTPYWGFECSDLVDPAELSSRVGVELTAVTDREGHLGKRKHGPSSYHYRQLGGLDCAWTNGQAERSEAGYVGLEISLLPNSTQGWRWATEAIEGATEIDWHCGDRYGCSIQRLVRDTWIVVDLAWGTPNALPSSRPVVEEYLARTEQALEAAPEGQRPSTDNPSAAYSTEACEAVITPTQVAAVYGRELVSTGWVDGPWAIQLEAERRAAIGCQYAADSGMDTPATASLSWIPDGEWAWQQARPTGEPIQLQDGQHATLSLLDCGADFCELNVLVDSTWIEWTMFLSDGSDPAQLAPALVEAFVATVGT